MTTWSIINGHLVFDTWKVNAIWLSRNMEAINIEAKKVNMSWHYFHDTTNFWLGNSCRIHHSINSSITSFCRAPGGSGETENKSWRWDRNFSFFPVFLAPWAWEASVPTSIFATSLTTLLHGEHTILELCGLSLSHGLNLSSVGEDLLKVTLQCALTLLVRASKIYI